MHLRALNPRGPRFKPIDLVHASSLNKIGSVWDLSRRPRLASKVRLTLEANYKNMYNAWLRFTSTEDGILNNARLGFTSSPQKMGYCSIGCICTRHNEITLSLRCIYRFINNHAFPNIIVLFKVNIPTYFVEM
jgi:hypothetical protein